MMKQKEGIGIIVIVILILGWILLYLSVQLRAKGIDVVFIYSFLLMLLFFGILFYLICYSAQEHKRRDDLFREIWILLEEHEKKIQACLEDEKKALEFFEGGKKKKISRKKIYPISYIVDWSGSKFPKPKFRNIPKRGIRPAEFISLTETKKIKLPKKK